MLENRWSEEKAKEFLTRYKDGCPKDLALRIYGTRLLGAEKDLCLHGGGNSSVKLESADWTGRLVPSIYVKAAGYDLVNIGPEGFSLLELDSLRLGLEQKSMDDETMVNLFRKSLFDYRSPTPSVETLLHACLPAKYIDHTHQLGVLILTGQKGGMELLETELGSDYLFVEYCPAGFELAQAAALAFEKKPEAKGMVLAKHGAVTWGNTAKESYEAMIELSQKADRLVQKSRKAQKSPVLKPDGEHKKYLELAPVIRAEMSRLAATDAHKYPRFVIKPYFDENFMELMSDPAGREILLTHPITPDHLVRSRRKPAWIKIEEKATTDEIVEIVRETLEAYREDYGEYLEEHLSIDQSIEDFDSLPRQILIEGVGGLCLGQSESEALKQLDILKQNFKAKSAILEMGGEFAPLNPKQCFAMEFKETQQAKLHKDDRPLTGKVALVTGAAGAIGAGIVSELIERDCHVIATDIDLAALHKMREQLLEARKNRVFCLELDVTQEDSIQKGIDEAVLRFGGIDILVINAGLAHVSSLDKMEEAVFERIQKVNTTGTLLLLKRFGTFFKRQGLGGDVVLVSTKNVFSPGAGFGAYSATKAAAHQLARIASLELAADDIRVNMVSPDAVFSEGEVKSGLWQKVGPDRMKARGLDEAGLEEYYRNRNLLKSKITATDVGRAVVFFVTRQTPTTGATLPVDGGLPDATPR